MYQKFIGIDIGKQDFYVALHGQKKVESYANTPSGISQFLDDFATYLSTGLVVLETTGGYESELANTLYAASYTVHKADTRKVKSFIRSHGKLGKSDTIDALGLSLYGYERHRSLSLYKPNVHKALLKLMNRRDDLKQMIVKEKNRLKAPEQSVIKNSISRIMSCLEEEVVLIDSRIKEIVNKDELLRCKQKELKNIAGIGDTVSSALLSYIPELGELNRKQIASLAGVAPHPNESGTKQGYRFVRGGRCEVKRMLFIAALTAARSKGHLGAFYQRLVEKGKKKMVALVALMRKIIVIANAKIRDLLAKQQQEKVTAQ